MDKKVSRRELYDLVWSRPMTKVATDFGISDVALHKICKKHRVPTPGRGYWAKVAAGKNVKQTLFREVQDAQLDGILIRRSPLRSLPPQVAEARKQAKARANTLSEKPQPPRSSEPGSAHPVIERMRSKLEKAKPRHDEFTHVSNKGLFPVSITPASIDRALDILGRLINQAEANGYKFQPGEGGLHLNVDDEPISFQMSEKTDKVPHELSESEAKALQRWEADCARKRRRGEWISDWDKPRIPEWNYVPNGKLVLQIDRGDHWDGLRRTFGDGKRQRLETMIDTVLVGAATCSASIKAKREEKAHRKREWEEQQKRRKERERRETLEAKRWEFLDQRIELLEQAQRIETFLEDYTSNHPEDALPDSCRDLIQWARSRSELIRETIRPEQLAETLDQYRLMDDSTEISSWVRVE